jgi:ankyrin repeat protein
LSKLLKAVFQGSLTAVKAAIKEGENINEKDRDGRTPLFQAVTDGNIAIVSELLDNGAEVNARDKSQETPLHFAAREHQIEIAKLLLNRGALVDAQDLHGNTPLGGAVFASRGRPEMILLLNHSADKTLKNKHGVSPEELAKSIGNYDVSGFLE